MIAAARLTQLRRPHLQKRFVVPGSASYPRIRVQLVGTVDSACPPAQSDRSGIVRSGICVRWEHDITTTTNYDFWTMSASVISATSRKKIEHAKRAWTPWRTAPNAAIN